MEEEVKKETKSRTAESRNILQGLKLVQKIKEECGYHKYEIIDILNALNTVAQKQFLQKKNIKIGDLGILYYKEKTKRKITSIKTKEVLEYPVKATIRYKVSSTMLSLLNKGESSGH